MADSSVTTGNARVNAWSNIFFNLGSALAAATGYRLFVEQRGDWTAALWIIVAMLFIGIGHGLLGLLEEQTNDDL